MLLLRLLFLGISSLIGFQLQLLIEISSLHVSLSLRFSRFIELLLEGGRDIHLLNCIDDGDQRLQVLHVELFELVGHCSPNERLYFMKRFCGGPIKLERPGCLKHLLESINALRRSQS